MNKPKAQAVVDSLKQAIKAVEKEHGVRFNFGRFTISYDETSMSSKMTITEAASAQELFDINAKKINKPELIGKYGLEFTHRNQTFKLLGINTKARKNFLEITDINTNKSYTASIAILGSNI